MQTVKRLRWLAAAASLLLLVGMSYAEGGGMLQGQRGSMGSSAQTGMPAPAQNAAGYPNGQMGTNNPAGAAGQSMDHEFMMKAAEGGLAEVQMGQLAQQNGESQQVKDFGQQMVTDHSKANDQLKPIAQQQGVNVPTELKGHEKAEYDRLSKLHGDAFDKAYSKLMVSDHKKDIAEFKREAESGTNPEVKNFASQTLPTLHEHLKMAEQLNGGSSSGHGGMGNAKNGSSPQPQ